MNLLDTAFSVTTIKRGEILSFIRTADNKLLVFDNHEGFKVESVGNLGLIRNVKVLANLTNIILAVYGLQILGYELLFRNIFTPS